MDTAKIGRWAFIVGLVISLAAGFVNLGQNAIAGLVILGIIVGLLNVTGKEVMGFLLATVALLLVGSTVGAIPAFGGFLQAIMDHFVAFVAGAALIVALREVVMTTATQ